MKPASILATDLQLSDKTIHIICIWTILNTAIFYLGDKYIALYLIIFLVKLLTAEW